MSDEAYAQFTPAFTSSPKPQRAFNASTCPSMSQELANHIFGFIEPDIHQFPSWEGAVSCQTGATSSLYSLDKNTSHTWLTASCSQKPQSVKVSLYLTPPAAVNSSGTCTPSSWGSPSMSSTSVDAAISSLFCGSVPVVGSVKPHSADFSSV